MTLPVAILAGGLATRMRPLTQAVPKALLDVGGQPFAARQLELLHEYGMREVVFCVGYLGEMVRQALGDGSRWGMRITYAFDGPTLRGTGGALRQALPALGNEFLVLYGDSYLDCDYSDVARTFRESRKLGLMTVFQNDGQWDRSNVHFEAGRILLYDKRHPAPEMRHIDYGLGALRREALESFDPEAPFDLATVYQELLARGELAGYETSRRFFEVGSPAGLEETQHYILQGRARRRPQL